MVSEVDLVLAKATLFFQISVAVNWVGPTLSTQSCPATGKNEQVLFCLFTVS